MSMMFDRNTELLTNDPTKPAFEQCFLDDEVFEDDLYDDRDSVLERELLETSLDDYDDLLAAVRDEYYEE